MAKRRSPTTRRWRRSAARGRYGFYEAVDFTPARVPEGEHARDGARLHGAPPGHEHRRHRQRRCCDGRMRERFHSDVTVQATELLLQERTPRDVSVAHPRAEEVGTAARFADPQVPQVRRLRSPHDSAPQNSPALERPLLGDGHRRRFRLQPLERPRASRAGARTPTRDDTGSYLLMRDVDSGRVLVRGLPTLRGGQPGSYEVELHRRPCRDHPLATATSSSHARSRRSRREDDAEVRRVSLTNALDRAREIEVTSYAELVLGLSRRRPSRTRRSRRCSCAPNSCRARTALLADAPAPRAR